MNNLLKTAKLFTAALLITMSLGCDRLWSPYLEPLPKSTDQCQTDICATGTQGGTCDYDNKKRSWEACSRPNCSNRAFDFTCPGAPEPNTDGGVTDMGGMPTPPSEGMHSVGVASYGSGTNQLICAPDQGPIKFVAGTLDVDWIKTPCTWMKADDARITHIVRINLDRTLGENPGSYFLDPATAVNSTNMNSSLQMSSSQWYWLDVTPPRIVRVLSSANRASGGAALNFRVFDPNSLTDMVCASAQTGGCDVP